MHTRYAALALTAALLAGCGGYDDTVVPPPEEPSAAPAAPVTTTECKNDGSEVRSYEPVGNYEDTEAVERIRSRGRIIAGVAADTYLLGARNPETGDIEGFDIDMVYAIADELFDENGQESLDRANRVELRVITAAQRIPFLIDGTIDIVARNMTVNCARWQQIAFSEIYFNAGQKVLVADDPALDSIEDLAGLRLCAPAGTTSIENIQKVVAEAIPVTSTDNSACMLLFQNGQADGVSTDDVVLAGLAAQDPYAKVLDTQKLTREPYGIATNKDAVGLVRLINKVLEDMRADGRWQDSYEDWLAEPLAVPGEQPAPVYGR